MNKEKKTNYVDRIIYPIAIPLLVVLLWNIMAYTGKLNTTILASPQSVGARVVKMVNDGSIYKHVFSSTRRVIVGFLIGSGLGIVLGTVIGLEPFFRKITSSLIAILRPIPPISMIPFFILWMGIGEKSKLTIIAIGAFWSALLNTIQGFQSTDFKLLEVAKVFGKNKKTTFFHIVLPSAVPSIFTGLRLGIGHSWTAVVTAEMVAASSGVGYMIQIARELQQPDLLLLGIICIGIVGLVIDSLMLFAYKKVVYWR